jgi:hypothetical protein
MYGETYTIPIRELVTLERHFFEGSVDGYFFRTSDGRRLELTSAYQNPIHQIFEVVRQLRPDLPTRDT